MPTTWVVEAGGATTAKCRRCRSGFQQRDQRLRMYQPASARGSAYANWRWHVTCVDEGAAQRVASSDRRVYMRLRAAQEEERHRAREERATAERQRQPGQGGIRQFFGTRGRGDSA